MNQSNRTEKNRLKELAVKVAAKNSDDLVMAVLEFTRLAYIQSVPPFINDPNNAEKIMKELLPPYRFPANDAFHECAAYYGYTDIALHGNVVPTPAFLIELKKKFNIPESLFKEIHEYALEFENLKIRLNKCIQEKTELESRIQEAERAWNGDETRGRKNALIVQALGFSTGKVQKRQDSRKIYYDYFDQVRKKGKSRREATEIIRERYSLPSFERTVRILLNYRKSIYLRAGEINPEVEEIMRKNLKGLVFDNRQVENIISPY